MEADSQARTRGTAADLWNSYKDTLHGTLYRATLDHLTNGRIGWNIVTGYLDSAARGVGLKQQIDHDDRYDRGDDFMDAFYKLLEEHGDEVFAHVRKLAPGEHEDVFRPYFGTIPDFGSEGEGYAIGGSAPGSPAEKGGLKSVATKAELAKFKAAARAR